MTQSTLRPEILVIGAGPSGAAAAWELAQRGHDALMIDAAEFPRDKACGDGLTPMAVRNLARIGALAAVEGAGARRIDKTRITGPLGVEVAMPFSDYQPDFPYALVLPRFVLDDVLRRHAIAGGAEFRGGVRVKTIERDGDRVTAVHAESPTGPLTIEARHVVIAVGANIGLLRRAGFLTHEPRIIRAARGYYADVALPDGDEYYDFYFDMELIPGYGWVFPTSEGRANVGVGVLPVFWATSKPARTLLAEFVARRRADGFTGMEPDGPARGYPLRIDFPIQRTAGENWVIVGEAAGLVNPVTGEGIDLGLESAEIAARTLHADIAAGRRDHLAYQRELWDRFGPMFSGLRILRDILITPVFTDYALWLMRQHRFLAATTMKIAQGIEPPGRVFHPLFILQFFLPVSPRLVADGMRKLFDGRR